jgi:hypothetical protein
MMDIEKWLNEFSNFWQAKNIDRVLDLFSNDVEYWETPFKKLKSKDEIAKEWQAIMAQENLAITTSLFASESQKHTATWEIVYDKDNSKHVWAGTYFIELNEKGKCVYFLQTGEQK